MKYIIAITIAIQIYRPSFIVTKARCVALPRREKRQPVDRIGVENEELSALIAVLKITFTEKHETGLLT